MVNILRLTVTYLNGTINVKPETQNRRLEPTGLAKPGETRGLTGTGPCLARQESAGRVFGWFWNRTDPLLPSKPGPLAGYPDPLLTLPMAQQCNRSAEHRHRGMFPSAAEEVAVVETPSLRSFQQVQGRETCPSLRLNLCECLIHDAEWVQRVGAVCEHTDSLQLEGVQDGVI
jgi:hypothetical protein